MNKIEIKETITETVDFFINVMVVLGTLVGLIAILAGGVWGICVLAGKVIP